MGETVGVEDEQSEDEEYEDGEVDPRVAARGLKQRRDDRLVVCNADWEPLLLFEFKEDDWIGNRSTGGMTDKKMRDRYLHWVAQ